MMPPGAWLAFVAASAALLAIPGPVVLMVVSHALGHGRRPAMGIAAGVALGDLTAMTASMAGMGAALAASATVFAALRWVGGAYLLYLGIRLWRAPVRAEAVAAAKPAGALRLFGHSYMVAALNPKAILFFVAFMPQFIDAHRPIVPQVALMELTFVALAMLNVTMFALAASAAGRRLQGARVQRAVNRLGGSLLIGAGIFAIGGHAVKV